MTKLSEKQGGGLIYSPAMMQFDGSTGYYSKTGVTVSGNKVSMVAQIQRADFTGDTYEVIGIVGNTYARCQLIVISSNHSTLTNRRAKVQCDVQNSTGTNVCKLISSVTVLDDKPHMIRFQFDGDLGTASLVIDGSEVDDTGNPDRVAPTTATLETGAGFACVFGSSNSGTLHFGGNIAMSGYRDALTAWSDIMDSSGNPKQTDFSGWLFGHFAGKMDENEGTAGAMTKNGTITMVDSGPCPHIGLPTTASASIGARASYQAYSPAMMAFDGSTGYYSDAFTSTGNKVTFVGRFNRASFTGGGTEYLIRCDGPTNKVRGMVTLSASDHATTGRQSKLGFVVNNSAGANICRIFSSAALCDGENHTFFIEFDGDAGTCVFRVDGSDQIDTGNGEYIAPTTGSLETGASNIAFGATTAGAGLFSGQFGFSGYGDTGGLAWSDFMNPDGTPKKLDESTWTEWGAQPAYWSAHGEMTNNLGSAGAMTKNGTIVIGDGGALFSAPVNATLAASSDIRHGKTAWVDGVELVGDAYTPAMMQFDGSTGYYSKASVSPSGNQITAVGSFKVDSSATDQRIIGATGTSIRFAVTVKENDHASVPDRLQLLCYSSGGSVICNYNSSITVADGERHAFLVAYDAAAGTAVMYVDGVEVGDVTAPIHVLTTGTLFSGTCSYEIGASGSGTLKCAGQIGFVGCHDAYLTNWSDFMHPDGSPKQLDESTWTEWGSQPLFWNAHGEMTNNLGSAGAMTKNGTIVVGDGGAV